MNRIFLLFIFCIFIWSFFIEPHLLVVKHYKVDSLNKKIVFASDFHISKHDRNRLKRAVKLINNQNPELVLLGGDFIKGHDGKNTLPIEEQAEILKQIKAPVISILGNHEGWYGKEKVTHALENVGITVLSNSNINIDGLYIAGLDDLQTGFPDIEKALKGTKSPRILLTHTPDIYYDVKEDVNLILAGHLHGGQIYIPFVGAPIVPSAYGSKFAERVVKETQNTIIITKGIGTSILPIRFCSVPEIVVIN